MGNMMKITTPGNVFPHRLFKRIQRLQEKAEKKTGKEPGWNEKLEKDMKQVEEQLRNGFSGPTQHCFGFGPRGRGFLRGGRGGMNRGPWSGAAGTPWNSAAGTAWNAAAPTWNAMMRGWMGEQPACRSQDKKDDEKKKDEKHEKTHEEAVKAAQEASKEAHEQAHSAAQAAAASAAFSQLLWILSVLTSRSTSRLLRVESLVTSPDRRHQPLLRPPLVRRMRRRPRKKTRWPTLRRKRWSLSQPRRLILHLMMRRSGLSSMTRRRQMDKEPLFIPN